MQGKLVVKKKSAQRNGYKNAEVLKDSFAKGIGVQFNIMRNRTNR